MICEYNITYLSHMIGDNHTTNKTTNLHINNHTKQNNTIQYTELIT